MVSNWGPRSPPKFNQFVPFSPIFPPRARIGPGFVPGSKKIRPSRPKVTKSLPKRCPKPPPGHLNLKLYADCKPHKNHCIYYVLGTSRHRVLVPCPLPNHKKNHSGIHTAIRWSKLPTSRQNDSKVGPPGLPKSIKNPLKSRFGPQGVRPNSNLFPVP